MISQHSIVQKSRRAWFKQIQKLSLLVLGTWFSPLTVFAKPEDAQKAIQEITGGKPLINGKVNLVIPPLVENGNLVVLKVSVESPMTANATAPAGNAWMQVAAIPISITLQA